MKVKHNYLLLAITTSLLFANHALADKSSEQVMNPVQIMNNVCSYLRQDKLQTIDLTHTVSKDTPNYEGKSDLFIYKKESTVEKDGYMVGSFNMPEHYGTHIDAPAHFIVGGNTIDEVKADQLVLPAIVIDVSLQVKDPDYAFPVEQIYAWEKTHGKIQSGAAVLLLTGWDKEHYRNGEKYRNVDANNAMHFPGYSEDATKFLVHERKVKALGIDTMSIDLGKSSQFPCHKAALSNNVLLFEGLTNLDKLPAHGSLIFAGPLKIKGGSGSPARIMALIPLL